MLTHNTRPALPKPSRRRAPGPPLAHGLPQVQRKAGSCACGGSCPRCKEDPKVQTKLRVSEPGDALEREADGIAESVMRMPASNTAPAPSASGAAPSTLSELSSSLDDGAPLDGATRGFFESRFQSDLSNVRVHSGTAASQLADSYSARAFTYGNHIVFNRSEYSPHTNTGKHLMAHELAHVQQQTRGPAVARQIMRAPASCDTATTGIDDAGARIDAAQPRVKEMFQRAVDSLANIDKGTLGLIDTHFHCPSTAQIKTIRENFAKLNAKILLLDPICTDAGAEACQQGKDFQMSVSFDKVTKLILCPSAFADETYLLRVFMDAAARLSGLSPNCADTDPCYGDAAVGAGTLFDNIDSYERLTLALNGIAFATPATPACGADDKRLIELARAQAAEPTDGDTKCAYDACGSEHKKIHADLERALTMTGKAISAISGKPNKDTIGLLDWHFNDHGDKTIATVLERFGNIKSALQFTLDNERYGCTYDDSIAFVTGSAELGKDSFNRVCLTPYYFGQTPRGRAETMIHECGHRIGLSVLHMDDIYDHESRFRYMSTGEALVNTDSYANFANAIVYGAQLTILPTFTATYGNTSPDEGDAGNFFRVYAGVEAQHPKLGWFNPTLGFSSVALFESDAGLPFGKETSDIMVSLLPGVRFADPRPGKFGGGYLGMYIGPSLAINSSKSNRDGDTFGFGAEGGLNAGWQWRWVDIGVNAGAVVDPFRDAGSRTVLYGGVSISLKPLAQLIPGD